MNASFEESTYIPERDILVDTRIESGKIVTLLHKSRSTFVAEGQMGPSLNEIITDPVGDPNTHARTQHERIVAEVRDQGLHLNP